MRDYDYIHIYIYILYEVSPGICADAILYREQWRGECIILLSAYNNIIDGVVPQTLPLCCRATAGRGGANTTLQYVRAYTHTRALYTPDKCAPFYAAIVAASSILSLNPSSNPLQRRTTFGSRNQ